MRCSILYTKPWEATHVNFLLLEGMLTSCLAFVFCKHFPFAYLIPANVRKLLEKYQGMQVLVFKNAFNPTCSCSLILFCTLLMHFLICFIGCSLVHLSIQRCCYTNIM